MYWVVLLIHVLIVTIVTKFISSPAWEPIYPALILQPVVESVALWAVIAQWNRSLPCRVIQQKAVISELNTKRNQCSIAISHAHNAIQQYKPTFLENIKDVGGKVLGGLAQVAGFGLGIFGVATGNHVAHHAGHILHSASHHEHKGGGKLDQLKQNLHKLQADCQEIDGRIKRNQERLKWLQFHIGNPQRRLISGLLAITTTSAALIIYGLVRAQV